MIFYLGHLEAFDWNLIGRGPLGLGPIDASLDQLFAFGIDPTDGNLPGDVPGDWPPLESVHAYVKRVREKLDECLNDSARIERSGPLLADGTLLQVAIEHRLMHAETLAYLLHQLPLHKKVPTVSVLDVATPSPAPYMIRIPAGTATLGQKRGSGNFGWDNEFEEERISVPEFAVDAYPVTNGQFLKFILAGGYKKRALWTDQDWAWKESQGIQHPWFWVHRGDEWEYRAMFAQIPLPLSWPVYVSQAEASAYARWKKKSLPTEAQWHRAAYGTRTGEERSYPWGEDLPESRHGNFNFEHWDLTAAGAHPDGASELGVQDLIGNGWEWTSTPFAPFRGFQAFPFYPGYSANFFDGFHFVMKGGSPRTATCMLRRSFRNWFQPHYPYIYATFRCVEA
ncbi:MAG: SUMF1/EgtB/PvdO family nonheme iron enzyme [Candidatus Acidiferrales bacterium]